MLPEGPDATRVIRELAQQGNEIIFTTSFGYMEPTLKVAKEFPNIKFEHMTGYKQRSANLATGNISLSKADIVQGVVAGMMTKTNKIGYVGSISNFRSIMGISFAQGLRSVNKEASISVIWANTWYDPVKKQMPQKFILQKVQIF